MRLIDADKLTADYIVASTTTNTLCYRYISKEQVENAPTVEAIPIELIKKEMAKLDNDIKWAWYYGNVALDKREYLKTWLTIKIEDWEKENEI